MGIIVKDVSELAVGQPFSFRAMDKLRAMVIQDNIARNSDQYRVIMGDHAMEPSEIPASDMHTFLGPDPEYIGWYKVRNNKTGTCHSVTKGNEVHCSF